MAKYLVFAGEQYEPNGGAGDLQGGFDRLDDIIVETFWDWAHIYDVEAGEQIAEMETRYADIDENTRYEIIEWRFTNGATRLIERQKQEKQSRVTPRQVLIKEVDGEIRTLPLNVTGMVSFGDNWQNISDGDPLV